MRPLCPLYTKMMCPMMRTNSDPRDTCLWPEDTCPNLSQVPVGLKAYPVKIPDGDILRRTENSNTCIIPKLYFFVNKFQSASILPSPFIVIGFKGGTLHLEDSRKLELPIVWKSRRKKMHKKQWICSLAPLFVENLGTRN